MPRCLSFMGNSHGIETVYRPTSFCYQRGQKDEGNSLDNAEYEGLTMRDANVTRTK